MKVTLAQTIYFLLVWIIIILTCLAVSVSTRGRAPWVYFLVLLFAGLIAVGILWVVYLYSGVCQTDCYKKDTKENMNKPMMKGAMKGPVVNPTPTSEKYNKKYSKDYNCPKGGQFRFEVTPAVACDGGCYTWNECQQKMCPKVPQSEYDQYTCQGNCAVGYPAGMYPTGTPVHVNFTNLTDDHWANTSCEACNK